MRYVLLFVVALLWSLPQARADDAPLSPEEAAKKVDQQVTLRMEVKSASLRGAVCFLNSEQDFRDPKNFTIFLGTSVLEKLKAAGVADPEAHFRGKQVRVKGKVTLRNDRPQIALRDADDIQVVEK